MRPFFSYYGAKFTGAKHYGPPRRDLVIEPFAGSACYSLYWDAEHVELYDTSDDVCDLWDFLIHCSEKDIISIPDSFEDQEEFLKLDRPERLLCGFWVAKGRAEPSNTLSPWYWTARSARNCSVWGPEVKRRILSQKPKISNWSIDYAHYREIDTDIDAHWHIDPPYNNSAGSRYPCSKVDYEDLAQWVLQLPGTVDVCENVGASWLPFRPLYEVVSTRGRRDGSKSQEAYFRLDSAA